MSALTSIQIQALVRNMDASVRKHRLTKQVNPDKYREKIVEENKYLYDHFPTIFEMHMDGKLDSTFFEMLKLRRKVELGELTDDEASRVIGQKLFDRFVAPVIGTSPPPEKPLSYSEYYKQYASDSKEAPSS
uniref:Uncharacterized protein n=1 Tax=viral metagenome TaxID=1070528 RepID=A0A6C0JZN3_9ZZZZ